VPLSKATKPYFNKTVKVPKRHYAFPQKHKRTNTLLRFKTKIVFAAFSKSMNVSRQTGVLTPRRHNRSSSCGRRSGAQDGNAASTKASEVARIEH
jgi:hypothetical protein